MGEGLIYVEIIFLNVEIANILSICAKWLDARLSGNKICGFSITSTDILSPHMLEFT